MATENAARAGSLSVPGVVARLPDLPWALAVLPAAALSGSPVDASVDIAVGASLVTLMLACAALFAGRPGRLGVLPAVLSVLTACVLLPQASYPGSGFVVAGLLGVGLGAFVGERPALRALVVILPGVAVLVIARAALGAQGACLLGLAFMILSVAPRIWAEPRLKAAPRSHVLAGGQVLFAAFAVAWVGSTAPAASWFGDVTSNGPRGSSNVAITFDDGPNRDDTLAIAGILEAHGVHGTFFEVGKAVVQQPDVTRELLQRGELVGNHSYTHGAFTYLDPTYPELDRTQKTIFAQAGVCPAFFRPPHGTHTPFMSHIASDHGMRVINWDVSAQDWIEDDPAALARHILEKVKPGSIVLLHDGLDGNPGADRSVVVRALPAILDGLAARGLHPVTLDKLLGTTPYTNRCGP